MQVDTETSMEVLKSLSYEELMELLPKNFFKVKPFYHQLVTIIYFYFGDNAALFFEMGTGKTLTLINLLKLKGIKDKILIVTVNEPLCYNWVDELKMNSDYRVKVLMGTKEERLDILSSPADCYIINYAGLDTIFPELYNIKWNAVILDECFIKSTKIKVGGGYKNIEDVKVGDDIYCVEGLSKVTGVFKKEISLNKLVKVNLTNGNYLFCSDEHLFFTNSGWVKSKNLTNKKIFTFIDVFDIIYNEGLKSLLYIGAKNYDMFNVWQIISKATEQILQSKLQQQSKNKTQDNLLFKLWKKENVFYEFFEKVLQFNMCKSSYEKIKKVFKELCILWRRIYSSQGNKESILWNKLFCKMESITERNNGENLYKRESEKSICWAKKISSRASRGRKTTIRMDEGKQSYVQQEIERKDEDYFKSYRTYFHLSWWQWKTFAYSTAVISNSSWLANRICCQGRKEKQNKIQLPDKLQNRYSKSNIKDSNRSKWVMSHKSDSQRKGFKKEEDSPKFRVESIEFLEQGNIERFRECFKQGEIDYEAGTIVLYDLEVEKHPSFFVGESEILVHNSRKIKNLDAKRTKYSILLGRKAEYRAILTGTPLINPLDIFAQFLFLDDGKTFGKFFGKFKKIYFIKEGNFFGAKWVINPDMIDKYLDKIFESSVWYSKEECLDLPEKVHQVINVKLSNEQAADYEKLGQGFGNLNIVNISVIELENRFIKCSQITSGFIKGKNGGYSEYADNSKLDTLMDLVETALEDTKVVIFHNFIYDALMIERELKNNNISFASLRGGIKNKDEQYKSFINDNNIKVMVAHPQSGGIGLNFTVANVCIYYSLSYDVESLLQSQDRLHRIGQKHLVTYYYLICRGTIDVTIKRVFEEKKNFIAMIKGKNLNYTDVVKGEGK